MKYDMNGRMGRWLISAGLILTAFTPAQVSAQNSDPYLVSVEELGELSALFIQLGLIASGAYVQGSTIHGVDIYKLTYRTTGVSGESTLASGALYVPQSESDSIPVILYQHGTIMNRDQVPSARAEDPPGLFFAGYGYAVAMADYLGLGENPGLHPYLHWETEATASLDMLRATREFMNDSLPVRESRLFLAGYSQGGHATMAVHKYIHVNGLEGEFRVAGSVPMSGPYALSTAQFDHIFSQDSTYTGSYYIPYIAASYQLVYGNLYDNHSEYYDPPYDSIFAAWESTGYYFDQLPMDSFPRNFYAFMQDSVMDNLLADPGHPFREDLRNNDLDDWAPQEPVRMLYCGMDMHLSLIHI
jgi:acetyl esterase/lipase